MSEDIKIKELTCINCPLGCALRVEMKGMEIISVSGNTCNRGDSYARTEVINPVRVITSSVRVLGGQHPVVAVKTREAIPKGKIWDCTNVMKTIEVKAPVTIGDVIMKNIAGTGVDLIASANMDALE